MKYAVVLVAALMVVGCQTSRDVNAFHRERLDKAEMSIKSGGDDDVLPVIKQYVTDFGENGDRARAMLDRNPSLKTKLLDSLKRDADEAKFAGQLINIVGDVKKYRDRNLISKDVESDVISHVSRVSEEANRSGRVAFDYSDRFEEIPSLNSAEAQSIIFDRSLGKVQGDYTPSGVFVTRFFDAVSRNGVKSKEWMRVFKALPNMKLSTDQIRTNVAPLFPDYAKKALEGRTIVVRLGVDPDDRLLKEDIASRLKRSGSALILAEGSQDAAINVTVKKLRWEERRAPERSQPVMYSQDQVNILAAVMLMPRNATYIYDVTTGGVELEYAFEIKAGGKGIPAYDDLLRNKVSREWRACSNARIQNVFGGIQPAGFVANNHMQQVCNGGSPTSVDALRDDALDAVVRSIKRIPAIDKVLSIR